MEPILLRPLINEKSMMLTKNNLYTFEVTKNATKKDVAKAVADRFDVLVEGVKIINTKPKKKMQRTRKGFFLQSSSKKAIVVVKKGQKIPIFELSSSKEETSLSKNVKITSAESEPIELKKETQVIKEKKSLFKGTKVRIEKTRGQEDLKTSHKERKKEGV